MSRIEEIRRKALELWDRGLYRISFHADRRMLERDIDKEDIRLVLLHGSLYKEERGAKGDIKYTLRGWDKHSRNIRVTIVIKELLLIITVIREE